MAVILTYHVAAPLLRRYGFPATVFVATGYVGSSNRWLNQHRRVAARPLLDRSEIRELRAVGNAPGRVEPASDRHALDRLNGCGALFKRVPAQRLATANFGLYEGHP